MKLEPNRVLYFSIDELKLNSFTLMDVLKSYSEFLELIYIVKK